MRARNYCVVDVAALVVASVGGEVGGVDPRAARVKGPKYPVAGRLFAF